MFGLGAHSCHDFVAIDSCLDAGHVYDYTRDVCDTQAYDLLVIPYQARHPNLIRGAALVTLFGIVGAAATWQCASGVRMRCDQPYAAGATARRASVPQNNALQLTSGAARMDTARS
jgi:hypothetical protein